MDDAIALDGFLDEETVPGDLHGTTARFRLTLSPTDERTDETILPCTVADPMLAHAVLYDLQPGAQLRVTGYLRLPRTPDEPMGLHVDAIEVLAAAPFAGPAEDVLDASPAELHVMTGHVATLAEHGLIERYGPYVVYHDPEIAATSVWTATGAWVGKAEYPATVGGLIDQFERGSAADES
ncbi:hypothetical protein [Streptomyces abikoensis]|uniref:Uncharacterized protein n=1 Tax=Streptomyces abikoensis TaxID=97398 RepID=A0ABW7THY2_9ACTN